MSCSMIGKILHIEKTLSKARSWPTSSVCSEHSWRTIPHLSLETVFAALRLTQNCYINMKISFSKLAI